MSEGRPTFFRELSPLEQWYTTFAKMGLAGLVCAFEMESGVVLDARDLERAAKRVAESQHQPLCCDLRPCPDRPTLLAWYPPKRSDRRVVEVVARNALTVEEAVQRELRFTYDLDSPECPRLRLVVVRVGEEDALGPLWFLVCTHHLFCDGRGCVTLAARILAELGGAASTTTSSLGFPPGEYDLSLRLWEIKTKGAPFPEPKFTAAEKLGGTAVLSVPPSDSSAVTFDPLLHRFSLDARQTAGFLASCKARRLSPIAVFVGAFGKAMIAAGADPTTGPYAPSVPIDLRALLPESEDPSLRFTMCNGLGSFLTYLRLKDGGQNADMWEIARAFSDSFGEGLKIGPHVSNWTFMRKFMERNECSKWEYATAMSANASNMGRLELCGINSPGLPRVTTALCCSHGLEFSMVVSTASGLLSVAVTHPTPKWSREVGQAVTSSLRASLLSCLS